MLACSEDATELGGDRQKTQLSLEECVRGGMCQRRNVSEGECVRGESEVSRGELCQR